MNFVNLEHKPTSDLGYSLPGVGVLGAGRGIGLFGHSLPSPAVQATSGNLNPGQNAAISFEGYQPHISSDSTLLSAAGESRKTKPELEQSRVGSEMIEGYETEEEDEIGRTTQNEWGFL